MDDALTGILQIAILELSNNSESVKQKGVMYGFICKCISVIFTFICCYCYRCRLWYCAWNYFEKEKKQQRILTP